MKIDLPLTEPQEQFVFSDAKAPAIVGGLGCVHPDTKIWTERGLMRISEITFPIRVLSWNEKDQRFQLSLSGGAYRKQTGSLYLISTLRGVCAVAGNHQMLSSGGMYLSADSLSALDCLTSRSPCHQETNSDISQISSPEDALHCSQIHANSMGHYADVARQYGQQLHCEEGISLISSQQSVDAQEWFRFFSCSGDLSEPEQEHTLRRLISSHLSILENVRLLGYSLEGVEGDLILGLCSRHKNWESNNQDLLTLFLEFREMIYPRLIGSAKDSHDEEYLTFSEKYPCCNSDNVVVDTIISIVKVAGNFPHYDMQVLNTNNYVDEFGFIHHNSGKSQAGITRLVLLLLSDKGSNGAYYMPTYDLLKLRAMPGVEELLSRMKIPFSVNKSDYTIAIKGYGNIIFRSYDKPERIIAYETAHSIVDELDTISKEKAALVWRKITERNRQSRKGKNTIGLVTTPDQGYNGFVYQKWVKENLDGYVIIKASTYSNPFLKDDYIPQIVSNYDPILADLYLNGEFVSLSDKKVYHFFDRKKHHSDRVIKPDDRLFIGLDFNIGGCCATTFVIDNNIPIAVDEFVSHDTYDFVNNLARYKGHKLCVYPDASGKSGRTNASASDIDIIRHAGYECDPPNENPFVRDRINSVNALLSHETMRVNTDKCPELTFALESQGYDKHGDPEKFNDHPAIDDWVDCMGYFLHRKYPVRKPITDVKIKFSW